VTYRPRIVDRELLDRLRTRGAVVIEGAKATGKTATATRHAASIVLLDVDDAARNAAAIDPTLLLAGATPRLIDEWHIEPALWNHVRRAVDERGLPGQFILTGSATPADGITRHTGAGRISRVRMRPMTMFETGHSTGDVSLRSLLDGNPPRAGDAGTTIQGIATRIAVGGWPGHQELPEADAIRAAADYMEEIRRTDVTTLDGRRRDPTRVGRVLRSLARNTATPAPITTITRDSGPDDQPMERATVTDYLDALERLMIVEDLPAWGPHLRSRSVVRRAPKRYFTDPSLAAAALRASPSHLLRDLNLMGLLFENLVIRDLRVYAQTLRGHVSHYRDNTGLEVDAIVETESGTWGAFEIKLGGHRIDDAAETLLKFADRVDIGRTGPPACLVVVVGTGYAYHRSDGVAIVPIGTLGP
jgi:uncharacterized protein